MNAPTMCHCGRVWLFASTDAFPAEGRMHMRTGCAATDPSEVTR